MRGTTPTHTFKLPFGTEYVAKAKVSYKHGDELLLRKDTADCKLEGNTISVTLTREETVKFPDDAIIKVQLEIETPAGDALKTRVYSLHASELLDEGALQ